MAIAQKASRYEVVDLRPATKALKKVGDHVLHTYQNGDKVVAKVRDGSVRYEMRNSAGAKLRLTNTQIITRESEPGGDAEVH